jgi:SAM-dependent methyltransferase
MTGEMGMTEDFAPDWLDLREPYDAFARHPGLAALLSGALPQRPRLLDLGAGTGSLLRWLAPQLGRSQAWTLVDADPGLVERAFLTTADRAEAQGWAVTWPGRRTQLVHAPGGTWRVEALIANLVGAPANLPLHQVDAVVCSALCDLVSEGWVEALAEACATRRLPFYATLNVDGATRFSPPLLGDALVARGFARDQRRDKGFLGPALGPAAPQVIAAAFARHGYRITLAPSPWRIPPQDGEMAAEIATGHAEAALRHERRAATAIEAWLARREAQADRLRLAVRIGHTDILALPPR